ncbi:hypothetical protein, partial [Desertivirga xinjiangensis]|uniref:hypothetical protein n=1 Tax=Desertivirga xinjiangensis TaxID=539206 RepID=UPI00210D36A1
KLFPYKAFGKSLARGPERDRKGAPLLWEMEPGASTISEGFPKRLRFFPKPSRTLPEERVGFPEHFPKKPRSLPLPGDNLLRSCPQDFRYICRRTLANFEVMFN